MKYKIELDCGNTRIDPNGIDTEVFVKNPVVLFNHDQSKVIGKCTGYDFIKGTVDIETDGGDKYEIRYAPDVIVRRFHMEGDVRVIDECEVVSISQVMQ
jgi:hypothetical protein